MERFPWRRPQGVHALTEPPCSQPWSQTRAGIWGAARGVWLADRGDTGPVMSTCSRLGEKHPPSQLSPGSLKSHQSGGHQEPRAGCPALPPGDRPCASGLLPARPRPLSSQSCLSPSLWPQGRAAWPAPGSSLLLSGGHSVRGRQRGPQHGWPGLWARISPAGWRQAASRAAGTLVWETEPNCFSPLEDPFPGDTRPLEVECPLATCLSATVDLQDPRVFRLQLLPRWWFWALSLRGHRVSGGVTDSSGHVTPEVPSTPEKTGVILNGLPAFYARILLLGAFCCHGYTQKAPTIQASVLIRELLKLPGLCSRPGHGSPRLAVSGALSSSSLNGGHPREPVCLLPAGGFIPETLQALDGRVDESVEQ